MKIMFVDISTWGHHTSYINALMEISSPESFAVLPEDGKEIKGRCRKLPCRNMRSLFGYLNWMSDLNKIAKEEKPDLIHFLDGDSIMRYFGLGFSGFSGSKIMITFHHLFPGRLREISMRRMLKYAERGVFHTEEITEQVRSFGCKNIETITYPCFLKISEESTEESKEEGKVLLALGATRYDKGLDILLEALERVTVPFRLIIAGAEGDFDEKYINDRSKEYREKVEVNLNFLTEEQIAGYFRRADIVVLPYRKIFDGASGPMGEGVSFGKTIIGPSHGSLGGTIKKNHVGYTFKSENIESLAQTIEKALQEDFRYDKIAKEYQASLKPETFQKKYKVLYEEVISRASR